MEFTCNWASNQVCFCFFTPLEIGCSWIAESGAENNPCPSGQSHRNLSGRRGRGASGRGAEAIASSWQHWLCRNGYESLRGRQSLIVFFFFSTEQQNSCC